MYECDSEVQWQLRHNKSTTVTQEYSGNRGTTAQRKHHSDSGVQWQSGEYCRHTTVLPRRNMEGGAHVRKSRKMTRTGGTVHMYRVWNRLMDLYTTRDYDLNLPRST
jgi:hypothetical protein